MGIRDRFADQYARQKTMTGPEKKANDKIKSDESYMEDFFHAKKLSR